MNNNLYGNISKSLFNTNINNSGLGTNSNDQFYGVQKYLSGLPGAIKYLNGDNESLDSNSGFTLGGMAGQGTGYLDSVFGNLFKSPSSSIGSGDNLLSMFGGLAPTVGSIYGYIKGGK